LPEPKANAFISFLLLCFMGSKSLPLTVEEKVALG
jgi:hypothetical protein